METKHTLFSGTKRLEPLRGSVRFTPNDSVTELEKYGHYLAYGVKICDKPKSVTELEKYGHYLAYGVIFYVKKTDKYSVIECKDSHHTIFQIPGGSSFECDIT